eukprot:TRINITY_DN27006_c0_g1_i1.p1 TRINITY_DN27006_c0_g1~~TRINITY_DN27006_c0_g1_i1.p1  ORF type:complete len:371 (+),score=68.55 TRINITY_DN27006_c0_g1_i1:53-1165(+)
MVHPVTLKKTVWREGFGMTPAAEERIEYTIEVWYILASLLFVVGSMLFIPGGTRFERVGCRCYDAGSVMFLAGSSYFMLETFYFRSLKAEVTGCCCCWQFWKRAADQILYLIGSLIFLFGTLVWDPDLFPLFVRGFGGSELFWEAFADVLFMVGSLMFALASFVSALDIHKEHALFKTQALIITTSYEFGGFLFIAGTMAFVPGFRCNRHLMELGAWMYLVGSAMYLLGAVLSLLKTVATHQAAREHLGAAQTIQRLWKNKKYADELLNSPSSRQLSQSVPPPSSKAIRRVQQATVRLQRLVRLRQARKEARWCETECCTLPTCSANDEVEDGEQRIRFSVMLHHAYQHFTCRPSAVCEEESCSSEGDSA